MEKALRMLSPGQETIIDPRPSHCTSLSSTLGVLITVRKVGAHLVDWPAAYGSQWKGRNANERRSSNRILALEATSSRSVSHSYCLQTSSPVRPYLALPVVLREKLLYDCSPPRLSSALHCRHFRGAGICSPGGAALAVPRYSCLRPAQVVRSAIGGNARKLTGSRQTLQK